MKSLVFACGICLLPLGGCGAGKIICETHADTYCEEGVTYWVDSCGDLEEVFEHCSEGCNATHTGCLGSCTPQCTGKCCGDDGCGGACPDNCPATGQTCSQNTCHCEGGCNPQTCAQLGRECGDWDDGCGTQITCGPCDAGETCDAAGQCQASNLPHFSFFVPNHRPDPTQPEVDNHHILTGSDQSGELNSSTATCRDWTTADGSSANGDPRCGLSWPRGIGGRGANWISELNAPGCAPGVSIEQTGGAPPGDDTVGGGGGYGGFYCFALEP